MAYMFLWNSLILRIGIWSTDVKSEETIAFYRAMGAEITDDPIKELAEAEPYDLQMTLQLGTGLTHSLGEAENI